MEADWQPVQGSNPPDDWRAQLQPDARGRIVNKIVESMKKHMPLSEVGLDVLQTIAVRFEEKIYSIATNQDDYLRKLSIKMLSMERQQAPENVQVIPNQNNLGQG